MAGNFIDFEEPVLKKQKIVHQRSYFEEEQAAAFQLERERKGSKVKACEAKEKAAVNEFLSYVVEGKQDKAEGLLKETPELALKKGIVIDLSKREFKDITGFQYALWALDWHMWRMLLKYLPKEVAALQLTELEEKETVYGKHFSLTPLINALSTLVKHYGDWYVEEEKVATYWSTVIGKAQLLLPASIANEYCHPTRSFSPCPSFTEEFLPRSIQLEQKKDHWFSRKHEKAALIGVVRSGWDKAYYWVPDMAIESCKEDCNALRSLSKMRQQQLESLKSELAEYFAVKELLKAHFSPDLTGMISGYL